MHDSTVTKVWHIAAMKCNICGLTTGNRDQLEQHQCEETTRIPTPPGICPECNGWGIFIYPKGDKWWSGRDDDCSHCDGTGLDPEAPENVEKFRIDRRNKKLRQNYAASFAKKKFTKPTSTVTAAEYAGLVTHLLNRIERGESLNLPNALKYVRIKEE